MRIIVTGTVGLNKGPYLEEVRETARRNGQEVTVCHVGEMMYREAPDVAKGKILDLPLARLQQLRRSVIKDILAIAKEQQNVIINTHATFRWRHGLFPAFDFDQLVAFDADIYIHLVDNVDAVHWRLVQDHQMDHSLKDLLVWREEENIATEMMMMGCRLHRQGPPARFYTLAMSNPKSVQTFYRLMLQPEAPRAYISFPMTHVADMPDILREIGQFRESLFSCFAVFDPGDVDEHNLYMTAMRASQRGQKVMEIEVLGRRVPFDVAEVLQVSGDINAQIYARDFQMIDQADMIISYIPELPGGKPGLSSGVERELQHAYEATKEVYIIWKARVEPSPFITETATKVFADTAEALDYFDDKGFFDALKAGHPMLF